MDKIYNLLQRRTASSAFIPQIDGLRFLAIWLVVVDHMHGFIRTKIPFVFANDPHLNWYMYQFFDSNGRKGVLLFFMISGFILGMPFAKHFLQNSKAVNLKSYFLRRITRLEPPYILNMVASYVLLVLYKGHEFASMFSRSFTELLPNLAASLVYMHNVLMPNTFSVNPVSWSLEIEVQFYILVPALVLIFRLPKLLRRIILPALVVFFTFIQSYYSLPVLTIYSFIQYFLMGFLLVDIYLSGFKLIMNRFWSVVWGLAALIPFIYLDTYRTPYFDFIFIPVLFGLVLLVMTNEFWRKIFSLRPLTAIGGMCYSIYLWHNFIISAVGNRTIHINFTDSYVPAMLWHISLLVVPVVGASAVFYLLIEKPCMDKDWPVKLWGALKNLLKKNNQKPKVPVVY